VVKSYPQFSQNKASGRFAVEQLGQAWPAGAWVGGSVGGGGLSGATVDWSMGMPQTSQ
jgi:hypothetical protein